MAVPPNIRSISPDSFSSDDASANILELLQQLNPLLTSVSTGLNKGLSLLENLNCIQKEVILQVPAQAWTAPSLLNSWVNYDTGAHPLAGYRIDEEGNVHLQGWIKDGGIPATAFTLPLGFRPSALLGFSVNSNNAFGSVTIETDGDVVVNVGDNTWLSLNGIYFAATQASGPPAFAGRDWPLLIDSGQTSPILDAKVISFQDLDASASVSHGGCGVQWEPSSSGKIIIRRASRLTPGRKYRLKLLMFPTY